MLLFISVLGLFFRFHQFLGAQQSAGGVDVLAPGAADGGHDPFLSQLVAKPFHGGVIASL